MIFKIQEKRFLYKSILLLALTVLYSIHTNGQEGFPYKYDDPACDDVGVFMEGIVKEANTNNERIFVISWIGKNEKYDLSDLRLKGAAFRLKEVLGFDAKRIVTATGGRSDSQKGRLEFYIGSKFVLEITTRIGQDICWTTPDIDPKELKNSKIRKSMPEER